MRSMLERLCRARALGLAISVVLVVAACRTSEEPPAERPAAVANPGDPATAGAITGLVKFEGTPPRAETITMDSDPYCQRQAKNTTETIIVALREVVRRRRISALKDLLGRVRVDADLAESRRRPDRLRVTRD